MMMSDHPYEPSCNCDSCFTIWRAEIEVEKAIAREMGKLRRQERTALWETMLNHFALLGEQT